MRITVPAHVKQIYLREGIVRYSGILPSLGKSYSFHMLLSDYLSRRKPSTILISVDVDGQKVADELANEYISKFFEEEKLHEEHILKSVGCSPYLAKYKVDKIILIPINVEAQKITDELEIDISKSNSLEFEEQRLVKEYLSKLLEYIPDKGLAIYEVDGEGNMISENMLGEKDTTIAHTCKDIVQLYNKFTGDSCKDISEVYRKCEKRSEYPPTIPVIVP